MTPPLVACMGLVLALAAASPTPSASPAASGPARTITVAADPYCPFNCESGDESPGIAIEILRLVYEPLGYQVRYVTMAWDEALALVRTGEADAVVGAFKTEAGGFVFPREPFARSSNCFFTREDGTWTFTGMEALSSVRLGVIRDYSYGLSLDDYIAHHADRTVVAEGAQALAVLFDSLAHGGIDAFVEDEAVADWHAKRTGAKVRKAGCHPAGGVFVAFSPAPEHGERSRSLAAIWDERVPILRRDGQVGQVQRKYR